jgi:hypothetical protein
MNTTNALCGKARENFSAYLDGTLNGVEMQAVSGHVEGCADCAGEFETVRNLQLLLASVGPVKVPEDLGLKLRLAISHENARRKGHWLDVISARWDNVFRPAILQYSAGLAGALVLIGSIVLLVGVVAAPTAVLAHDEPLGALTAPHYLYSAAPLQPVVTPEDTLIVIQADINAKGEVYDYKFLSGPENEQVQAQVRYELMLQRFQPAQAFGEPIRGQVLITFAGASVRG